MNGGLIITIIPLISTLLGFYNFLYFISIGYGASLAFNGLSLILIYYNELNKVSLILCIFLIIYGIRLCSYLIIREFCLKTYIKTVKNDINRINSYSTFINIISWIFCSLLYTALTTPVYYIIVNKEKELIISYISIMFIFFGFFMEVIADHQKTIAKKKNPKLFVSQGLYKIVRCPNYLGEIIIWIGFFLSAIQTYKNFLQFINAFSGLVTVIFIMFGGARRLELRQDKNYGELKEYKMYKSTVPIIIPFVPLYSVKEYTWLVG